jgi:hypothetical protein
MLYRVTLVNHTPEFRGEWNGPFWRDIEPIRLDSCREESSTHRPLVRVRLAHDNGQLFGIFDVQDRFVRCTRTGFQDEVWKDSCVEIFLRPPGDHYFNFEFNCGGALRCSFRHVDCSREPDLLTPVQGALVRIYHSLPAVVDPEIPDEIHWTLEFAIPRGVIEDCLKKELQFSGTTWRANLFKCADESSHPHWLSWAPVPELNFHRPGSFGELIFS